MSKRGEAEREPPEAARTVAGGASGSERPPVCKRWWESDPGRGSLRNVRPPAYATPPGSVNGSSPGNRWSLADARTTGYRTSRLRRLSCRRPAPGRRLKGGDVATWPVAGNVGGGDPARERASSLSKAGISLRVEPDTTGECPRILRERLPSRCRTTSSRMRTTPSRLRTSRIDCEPTPIQFEPTPSRLQTDPESITNRSRVDPNRSRVDCEPTPSRLRTDPESITNRSRVDCEPTLSRLQTDPESITNRPRVDCKPTQSRLQTDAESITNRLRVDCKPIPSRFEPIPSRLRTDFGSIANDSEYCERLRIALERAARAMSTVKIAF
jgi:hypothetical protein